MTLPNRSKYILTSDGELYHGWLKKGEQSEDHKYIRREWKNGRWVYYYEDDPKNQLGSNFRTTAEIEQEKAQREAEKAKEKARIAAEKAEKEAKAKAVADSVSNVVLFVATGTEWLRSRMDQRVVDIVRGDTNPLSWPEAKEVAEDNLNMSLARKYR